MVKQGGICTTDGYYNHVLVLGDSFFDYIDEKAKQV